MIRDGTQQRPGPPDQAWCQWLPPLPALEQPAKVNP